MNSLLLDFHFSSLQDGSILAPLNVSMIRDEDHCISVSLLELERGMIHWLREDYQAVLTTLKDDPHAGHFVY